MEPAIFWEPFMVSEEEYAWLERNKHEPTKQDVDGDKFREDHALILARVWRIDAWYCIGRTREGEAEALCSRASRGMYGKLEMCYVHAPNLNGNPRQSSYTDHQLIFAKRIA